VKEMKNRSTYIICFLALLPALLVGCGSLGTDGSSSSGSTSVTVSIGGLSTTSEYGMEVVPPSSFSYKPHIENIRITITSDDMAPVERTISVSREADISESFEVDNGLNRVFSGEALDEFETTLYEGSNSVDLDGEPVDIPLMLLRAIPFPPSSLTTDSTTASSVSLSWIALESMPDVTGYNVYREGILIGTTPTTVYSDTGLDPVTTYCYRVSAHDAEGIESYLSRENCATTD
jgi:hypothetical protein